MLTIAQSFLPIVNQTASVPCLFLLFRFLCVLCQSLVLETWTKITFSARYSKIWIVHRCLLNSYIYILLNTKVNLTSSSLCMKTINQSDFFQQTALVYLFQEIGMSFFSHLSHHCGLNQKCSTVLPQGQQNKGSSLFIRI